MCVFARTWVGCPGGGYVALVFELGKVLIKLAGG